MKHYLKQLGKDSLVYGFGGSIGYSLNFFLLPIYTRIFIPSDYGNIEMLMVITNLLGVIVMMGMDSAQSFYFFKEKEKGQKSQAEIVTAIFQWQLVWGGIIVVIAMFFSPFFNTVFFNGQLTWKYFAIAFVGVISTQLMSQSIGIFRLLYRPWSYISLSVGNALLAAIITVTLVVWLDWGILGYFVGISASTLIITPLGWLAIRSYLDWSTWHFDWWPQLVRFGAPFVPLGLSMYILNTSDRWFIGHYCNPDELGIYAVGAKFALIISFIVQNFRLAWWPICMDAIHQTEGPSLLRVTARLYLGLAAICVVLLTTLSPLLVSLFTAPAYHSAYLLVGILAWSPIFFGFALIVNSGLFKTEKTGWAAFSSLISAVLNIGLNWWLVPIYGGIGAAIVSSLSFFIRIIISGYISERLWPVGYPIGNLALQVGIGGVATTWILILYSQNQELWKVVTIAATAAICLVGLSIERKYLIAFNKYGLAWWMSVRGRG